MTHEKIRRITEEYFPGAIGLILTGSQAEREDIDPDSDVDLLLFHPDFGSMYNRKFKHKEYQLDFTIAPLFDLINTIFNQQYDSNGTFLSMVAKGRILSDTRNILSRLQQYVSKLYNQISPDTRRQYDRMLKELERMNRLFRKDLKEHEKIFLICEFVSTVVAIETIRLSNWRPTIKHRARMIYDRNKPLSDQLVSIIKQAGHPETIRNLDHFLSWYTTAKEHVADLPVRASRALILDLSFTNTSTANFVHKVLPLIQATPELSPHYRYYYASPSYWPAYRHAISIRIEGANPDQAAEIAEAFLKFLGNGHYGLLEARTIFPKERGINETLDSAIEKMNGLLCEWHTILLKDKSKWETRWLLAMQFCLQIARMIGLNKSGLIAANQYLLQRSLTRQKELKQIASYEDLQAFRAEKYRLLDNAFKSNSTLIDLAATGSLPQPILIHLQELIDNKSQYTCTTPFTYSIFGLIGITHPLEFLLYITLTEECMQLLNLRSDAKNQLLFCMTKVTRT